MRWFPYRKQPVYQGVGSFFQEHAPGSEDSQHRDANQQECPDRHFANAEAQPDDVRLMNKVQAVGIESDQAKQSGRSVEKRDESGNADDLQHATRARGEIDEDVGNKAMIKLQRRRIEN